MRAAKALKAADLPGRRARSDASCLIALFFLSIAMTGCGSQDIRVYDVAKEKPVEMPHTHIASASPVTLPEGWETTPGDAMRVGSYRVRGDKDEQAQISIVPLAGASGGELSNVNRWRGQVGLPPIDQAQMAQEAQQIQIAGDSARLFEFVGGDAVKTRVLAAIQEHEGSTWFFKMIGHDAVVSSQKPAFIAFLKSYDYHAPRTAAAMAAPEGSGGFVHPPIDGAPAQSGSDGGFVHPPVNGMQIDTSAAPATEASSEHNWNAPKSWQSEQPGPMQDAKFSAQKGKAIVTVSILTGTAGGTLPNVNRWRGQIGLPPMDEAQLEKAKTVIEVAEGKAMVFDLVGPKQRMIAAILPRGDNTWFFKLLGDESSVGAEKNAFIAFVKSTK